ncbi:MAG: knotted carbamoyltransferase YgeW [Thermoplasmata archaeon]
MAEKKTVRSVAAKSLKNKVAGKSIKGKNILGEMVNKLSGVEKLAGKSLIETKDYSVKELETMLDLAKVFKQMDFEGKQYDFLPNSLFLALFFDQSTRTKTSWAGASTRLGGRPVILEGSSTQVSHGETPIETGAMMGMNAHAIGIRHDMIIGEGNKFIRETKKGIDEYAKHEGWKRHVPFVNLQCDIDHPTQVLADLAQMREYFKGDLAGKKFVISWAYSPSYAKPLSVPQGLITLLTRFGMDVTLAYPKGYDLMEGCVKDAQRFAKSSGGKFEITNSMKEAVKGADIVYAKSWGPYEMMLERVELSKKKDSGEQMKALEKRMLELNAKYIDWEYNSKLEKLTNKAKYMHCLPADITGRMGKAHGEVSGEVFDKHRMFMYQEANWKPYVIAAAVAGSLVPDLKKKLMSKI